MMKTSSKHYRQKIKSWTSLEGMMSGLLGLGVLCFSLPTFAVVWPQPESAYHSLQRHPQWIEVPKLTQMTPQSQLNGKVMPNQTIMQMNGFPSNWGGIPSQPIGGGYGGAERLDRAPYGRYAYPPSYRNNRNQSQNSGFPNFGNWNMPNIPSMSAPNFHFPSFGW